jgi:hypothetical protein
VGGGGSLGSNIERPFQRAAMIQGVVFAAVNGAFEICHDIGGLVVIQVGLADPSMVRWVNVTSRGQCSALSNVGMGGIVMEAAEEYTPAVKAADHIHDAGGYLVREIQEPWGGPMNHQQAEEGLRDGLTKAAKFCGKAMDKIAVLHNRFSREHVSLEESSEYGHQSSTGRGLVTVHQILEHGDALVGEGDGNTLEVG